MSDEFDVGVPDHIVTARLGRGGMASVYLAHDQRLNRKVAIKVMDGTLEADPDFIRRFEREAQVAAGLVHPNIVSVHHYGQTDSGRWYLTMDYVDGGSLGDRLKRGPLELEAALAVTRDIASALAAAHERQIVHRDIKPDNIMFQGDTAYLTDFGIAKLLDATTQLTTAGSPGTVRYMSPEQIDGGAVDGRTDIYALGVVLFEMLTGELPVDAPSLSAMLYRIAHEPPAPLPAKCSGLQPLLDAMLAKDPNNRVADCRQLGEIVRTIQRNVIRGLPQNELCNDTSLAGPARIRTPAHTRPVRLPEHMGDTQTTPAVEPAPNPRTRVDHTRAGTRVPGASGLGHGAHTHPDAGPPRRRPLTLVLLIVLALAVAGGGTWLGIMNDTQPVGGTPEPEPLAVTPTSDPATVPDAPPTPADAGEPTVTPPAVIADPPQPAPPPVTAAPPPGVVTITTIPGNASLSIDGGEPVMAPLAGEPMPAGRYQVRATAPGHEPIEAVVNVSSGDVLRRQLKLEPLPGGIRIDSTPRGAWIEVDGQRIASARTPHTVVRLLAGSHNVQVGLDGFEPANRVIEVQPGATSELDITLGQAPTAALTVNATPADATITIVDAPTPYAPGMQLTPGRWQIEVSRTGYETRTLAVDVPAGQAEINAQLEPLPVVPQLVLAPADARVEVERGGNRRTWRPGEALPPGPLVFHVTAPGHAPVSTPHELSAQRNTLSITLQAERGPGSSFRDQLASGGNGPWMTVIPAGRFRMGDASDTPSPRALPLRDVRVPAPLAVARNETSWDEYNRFALATGRDLPDDRGWGRGTRPVIMVSWQDATAYADWLSRETGARYRLLSEAEWEYAARAGTSSRFSFGDDPARLCSYANVRTFDVPDWPAPVGCDDGHLNTAPVGSFEANRFGLHDLHGNVSEWVRDCWQDTLEGAPTDTQPRVSAGCERRVIRGGSFYHAAASVASAFRYGVPASTTDAVIGFRVAREL